MQSDEQKKLTRIVIDKAWNKAFMRRDKNEGNPNRRICDSISERRMEVRWEQASTATELCNGSARQTKHEQVSEPKNRWGRVSEWTSTGTGSWTAKNEA